MKRLLLSFVALLCMLFAFSSCKKSSIDSVYSCGLHTWNSSSFTDLGTVENYIKQNNCPYGNVVIRAGKSEADNDKTIKAQFDAAVSKLNFNTLDLDPSTSFKYSVLRATESEENIIVASVSFNL